MWRIVALSVPRSTSYHPSYGVLMGICIAELVSFQYDDLSVLTSWSRRLRINFVGSVLDSPQSNERFHVCDRVSFIKKFGFWSGNLGFSVHSSVTAASKHRDRVSGHPRPCLNTNLNLGTC